MLRWLPAGPARLRINLHRLGGFLGLLARGFAFAFIFLAEETIGDATRGCLGGSDETA